MRFRNTILCGALVSLMATEALAQRTDVNVKVKIIVQPQTHQEIMDSISQPLAGEKDPSALTDISSDLEVYSEREDKKILPTPFSGVGVPSSDFGAHADDTDVSQAYSAIDLLKQSLQELSDKTTFAQKIQFLQSQAVAIIKASGRRDDEETMRDTLNRALDFMCHVLPSASYVTEEVQRWVVDFYKTGFELAASLANNHIKVESLLKMNSDKTATPTFALQSFPISRFGRIYSDYSWKFTTGDISNSAKAIGLMRIMSYMAFDIDADIRKADNGLLKTLADLYRARKSTAYNDLLKIMRDGGEPTRTEVNVLRAQIFRIRNDFRDRLIKAGIETEDQQIKGLEAIEK